MRGFTDLTEGVSVFTEALFSQISRFTSLKVPPDEYSDVQSLAHVLTFGSSYSRLAFHTRHDSTICKVIFEFLYQTFNISIDAADVPRLQDSGDLKQVAQVVLSAAVSAVGIAIAYQVHRT